MICHWKCNWRRDKRLAKGRASTVMKDGASFPKFRASSSILQGEGSQISYVRIIRVIPTTRPVRGGVNSTEPSNFYTNGLHGSCSNMDNVHQHRPQLQQGHRPRHSPQQHHGPRWQCRTLKLECPWMPMWPQVVTLTPSTFDIYRSHRCQYKPWLQQGQKPRCGPQ